MQPLILGLALASLAAQEPKPQSTGALLGTESQSATEFQVWVEHADSVQELRLERIVKRTPKTFRVETAAGTRLLDRQTGNHFRGTLEGDPGAKVAAFYAGDKLHALVLPSDGSGWALAPDRDAPGSYESMTLEEAEWLSAPFECGTQDYDLSQNPRLGATDGQATNGGTTSHLGAAPEVFQVALDSDYEFFLWHGGTEIEAAAFMEGQLLTCSLLFERDFNVRMKATEIVIRTDPNAPGYPYTTSGPCGNPCMGNWWSSYVGQPFQTVHQFSGKAHSNANGIASLWALCADDPTWNMWGWHSVQTASTYVSRVRVMTHELGHNFGCMHTNAGIMGPTGSSGSLTTPFFRFDPVNISQVQTYLSTLDPNCGPGTTGGSVTPLVSSILPGTTTPLSAGQLTVQGTDLQNTLEVELNGRLITLGQFDVVSDTELHFDSQAADFASLGTQSVTLHGPNGSSSGTFQVVTPATPEIEVVVYGLFGPDPQVFVTSSYEPGWTSVVLWSYTNATFPQGSLQLLQNASVVEVGSTAANGMDTVTWTPLNDGIATGSTIYMQTVLVDPVTGTRAASPVVEVLVDII